MKRLLLAAAGLLVLLTPAAGAETVRQAGVTGSCDTRISSLAISHARHRFNLRRQARATAFEQQLVAGGATAPGPQVTKLRHVAVVEDDGTIVPPPNPFDLGFAGVQFRRSGPGVRVASLGAGVSAERGERLTIGDDDDRPIDLPFSFRFYGIRYTRVFLNSDGNLTFDRAESASTARSLSRFLEGPPRIAAYFVDLDPSAATGDGGLYLLVEAGRVRITWFEVPRFGETDRNTIQLTLFPTGRITIAFGAVESAEGIVGVSPGGPGALSLVDLSEELPLGRTLEAVAERFVVESEIDDLAAAAAVLSVIRDQYTHMVVFADFGVDLGNAFAYQISVKNEIDGIGLGRYDFAELFGSEGVLESYAQMGSLVNYPADPKQTINPFVEEKGITVLAHEVGHRWLAFPLFRDERGQLSTDLLGRQLAHWSFLLDSDGSVMEGNDIRDNGDGRFTTVATNLGYSPLDQYLMGLRPPAEVPPFFYVSGSQFDPATNPATGVIIQGQRQDVAIDQVIAAEGERDPAVGDAPTRYTVAFVLVGRQGEPPSLESIKKVGRYRRNLARFFRETTGGRGRLSTSLRLRRTGEAAAAPDAG